MRKTILLLLIIFGMQTTFSQDFKKVDYEAIKTAIQSSSSQYYYPKLMQRLTVSDTTLTKEEYRHLYFGYVFQPEYNSFWRLPNEEKLRKFYQSDNINPKDYDEVIRLAEASVASFPFDLRQMNFLRYIYDLMGNTEMADKLSKRFDRIVDTILTSGDGKTCETGFHVLIISHEYDILNIFKFQYTGQSLIDSCDYIKLEEDKYSIKGIYFNIEKMLENESKALLKK